MADEPTAFDAAGLGLAVQVLDGLPDPVILLDGRRRVVGANRAAHELLQINLMGRDLAQSLRHPVVLATVATVMGGGPSQSMEITMPPPVRRAFALHVASLPTGGGGMGAVIVLRDVTLAKRAEQMRADFVANVSHELRSPLSSLVGMIETLRGAARDDEAARERFLDIMHAEAERMTRLIDDLLSLSKVEIREHIVPREPVDLAAVLGTVVELLHLRAAERSMTVTLDCPAGLPPVQGDRDELIQVFQNLLDNAIKYGAVNTLIRIEVRPIDRLPDGAQPGAAVSVIDRGEGIAEEDIPRLTERFYRVDKGRSRSMGGTGLGLAIVKHIVNRHRGRLTIHSQPGQGSTFTVMLRTIGETSSDASQS